MTTCNEKCLGHKETENEPHWSIFENSINRFRRKIFCLITFLLFLYFYISTWPIINASIVRIPGFLAFDLFSSYSSSTKVFVHFVCCFGCCLRLLYWCCRMLAFSILPAILEIPDSGRSHVNWRRALGRVKLAPLLPVLRHHCPQCFYPYTLTKLKVTIVI